MKDPEKFKKGIKPIKDIIESNPEFAEAKLDVDKELSKSLYGLKQEHVSDAESYKMLEFAESLLPFINASVVLDEFGGFHGMPDTGRRGWEKFLDESNEENLLILKQELDKNPMGINNMIPIISLAPILLSNAGIDMPKITEEAAYLENRVISEYQHKEEYDETARVGLAEDVKLLGKMIVKGIIDHYSQ